MGTKNSIMITYEKASEEATAMFLAMCMQSQD
jgi:hypothetical protein